uniref:V-type proton ATPase subunit n=1 Tax=Entamoeba invadens TaxID=33085 RepID=S0B5I2_ENTIV|nr:vacuolar ATP synthase subunit D, putative [Entamoeba invadens]
MLGGLWTFNVDDGFLEACCRGLKAGLLTESEYTTLTQSNSLEDMKVALLSTDYKEVFQNEPSPITVNTIKTRCQDKLVQDFFMMQSQAYYPLSKFMEFLTIPYMIDNVILLLTGTQAEKDVEELKEKLHPLGMFSNVEALPNVKSINDLYHYVLIDTPLGNYLSGCISEEDLTELNVEIVRNTLYKGYLEEFYAFCEKLGGETTRVMEDILNYEADRRAITVTINSFGTDLSRDDRTKLFPNLGLLYPVGMGNLAKATDMEGVVKAVEYVPAYKNLMNAHASDDANERSLEEMFFDGEVDINKSAYYTQMGYAVFYSWLKLKEQEVRNLMWIGECIAQDQKEKVNQNVIRIF